MSADRVRHVRRFSDEAHAEVDGPIDVLLIDGAHRYAPARRDIHDWGARVAPGGVLLIHDSFSSVGVTLAIGRELVAGRRFRYVGRARSLAVYHADLDATWRSRAGNATRQLAQLPWFARNVGLKVVLTAGARRRGRAGHRASAGVAVLMVPPRRRRRRARRPAPRTADRVGSHRARAWRPSTRSARRVPRRRCARAGPRGALVRGLGRSYGDAAQNSGGLVLRLPAAAGDVLLDAAAGTVFVPAGLSLGELLHLVLPHGFFVAVLPGTMHVTVGGAIASDIHGKNHHRDGSFGSSVESLRLLLGRRLGRRRSARSADRRRCSGRPSAGMGLTGIVVDATLRLLPVETSRMSVDTTRIGDLDTLMAAMADSDHRYRYSVAWIDLVAKGAHLGRSILTNGDHATLDQLAGRAAVGAAGLRAPPARHRPAGDPARRAAQPPLRRRVQRAVVPQVATPPGRAAPTDRVLLLPARPGRRVEPLLRARPACCSTSSSCRSARRRRCAP